MALIFSSNFSLHLQFVIPGYVSYRTRVFLMNGHFITYIHMKKLVQSPETPNIILLLKNCDVTVSQSSEKCCTGKWSWATPNQCYFCSTIFIVLIHWPYLGYIHTSEHLKSLQDENSPAKGKLKPCPTTLFHQFIKVRETGRFQVGNSVTSSGKKMEETCSSSSC